MSSAWMSCNSVVTTQVQYRWNERLGNNNLLKSVNGAKQDAIAFRRKKNPLSFAKMSTYSAAVVVIILRQAYCVGINIDGKLLVVIARLASRASLLLQQVRVTSGWSRYVGMFASAVTVAFPLERS